MGRPPRAPQGASTAKVTVRLPEQVAAGWRAAAAAAELTVSDWVRGQVAAARPGEPAGWVGRRPPRRRTGLGRAVAPPVDPAVVVQLARIGNNLNQIARHLNATGGPLTVAGLVTLQTIAADIDAALRSGLPARAGRTTRAGVPILLQVLDGRLRVGADGEHVELSPGGLVHIGSRVPHEILALEPSRMALTMLDPRSASS